ncbi:MAG TPA: hypothetical protein VFW68_09110 [Rhodocyclaceae bacterium]|nr:hypothetical protein [Rhodocyclaceae bacterium]
MSQFFFTRGLSGRVKLGGQREPIPHRFLTLRALRLLGKGHQLIVAGDASFLVFLDGIPDIALIADYLLEKEWICPLPPPSDVVEGAGPAYYALSDLGATSLQVAEAWWNELSLKERLRVRLWG